MVRFYFSFSARVFSRFSKLACLAAFCVTWWCPGQLAAQKSDKQTGAANDYRNEAVVIEQQRSLFSFAPDGTETRELITRARVQSDAGVKDLGLLDLQYAADLEDLVVKRLELRKPDGTVVDVSSGALPDSPTAVTRAAPMYTDQRSRQIPIKGLSVGDVVLEDVIWQGKKPLLPGQFVMSFYFNRQMIVLDSTYEVRVPAGSKVNVYSGAGRPVERDEAGAHVYQWHDSHTTWTEEERKPKPRTHPQPPDVMLSSFASWAAVGQWYWNLEKDRPAVTPAIQAKADELTKNATTDDEKIRALYDYVSTNIRYIGISLGQGRFQPHSATEVLDNKYGDCKDKHTLLTALLKAKGFQAEPVLIGSGIEPLPGVPAPSWFDHLITVLPRGDNRLWMDTTPEVAPMGLLMAPLYDRKALVVRDGGLSELLQTPQRPQFPTYERFNAEGTLDAAKTFKGKFDFTFRGQTEVMFRSVFHQISRAQWDQMTQNISRGMNFAGTVSDVDASPSEDLIAPFHLSYAYERKNLGDNDDKTFPAVLPPLQFQYGENDDRPLDTIFFGVPGEIDYQSKVHVPIGKRIDPAEDVQLKTDFAEYVAKYSFKDGIWSAERKLTLLKREIPVARWDEYIKFQKAVYEDENHMTELLTADAKSTPRTAASAHAEKLVLEAGEDLRDNRYDEAKPLLDQAKAEDPNVLYLWRNYGAIAMNRGHTDEGLKDAQLELANHPEEEEYYPWVVRLEGFLHHDDEQMNTWRALLKQNPANADGVGGLTAMLISRKQNAEAHSIAGKAAELKPDDGRIQFLLGRAALADDKKSDGLAALERAVKLSDRDLFMNDAAYSLAEANTGLDQAADWSVKATKDLEQQTADLTLDNAEAKDFARMIALAAYWDTVAWVRFKQGDIQQAEEYGRSAWMLSQTPVTGLHYAEILVAEHKRDQAIEAFRLAAGLSPSLPDALRRLKEYAGANSAPMRGEELSKPRTIALKRTTKSFESAEFKVLFAGGKISDVRWVEGADALKSAADKIRESGYKQPMPSGSSAKIVRRGVLACSPQTADCMFVLFLPPAARN